MKNIHSFKTSANLSLFFLLACIVFDTCGAISNRKNISLSADSLPGKGLRQHDFLYAGEWQNSSMHDQKMYIIKDGKITWSYTMPQEGEYGDAFKLSNGNIIFSRKDGASEITPDKKIVWNYDAPKNAEMHTCQPLGLDRVFLIINSTPAKAIILRKKDNHIEKELVLKTGSANTHGMFRHCRYNTRDKTFLIAHMDLDKVVEYNDKGEEVWTVNSKSPWAAIRLKNGNTLVSGNSNGFVREFNKEGKVVWEYTREDAPAYLTIYTIQEVNRLANGNTLISNWCGGGLSDEERMKSVQFFEVTPDKKVVWALSQWQNPDLGPASTIQLLDEPGIPEKGELQK